MEVGGGWGGEGVGGKIRGGVRGREKDGACVCVWLTPAPATYFSKLCGVIVCLVFSH